MCDDISSNIREEYQILVDGDLICGTGNERLAREMFARTSQRCRMQLVRVTRQVIAESSEVIQ